MDGVRGRRGPTGARGEARRGPRGLRRADARTALLLLGAPLHGDPDRLHAAGPAGPAAAPAGVDGRRVAGRRDPAAVAGAGGAVAGVAAPGRRRGLAWLPAQPRGA